MPSRNISATGSARTSPPICRRSRRWRSSRATRPSRSRAKRWTSARSRASWVSATCSKAACARPADAVRITAQLIDGATGDHVWAERYDRDLTDIFAIQDEISKAIVDGAEAQAAAGREEGDRAARDDQRRGLQSLSDGAAILGRRQLRRVGANERVIRMCQRAIEIDPDYARAWALMAFAQASLRYPFDEDNDDAGMAAAEARACSSIPTIAEAHLRQGPASGRAGQIRRGGRGDRKGACSSIPNSGK